MSHYSSFGLKGSQSRLHTRMAIYFVLSVVLMWSDEHLAVVQAVRTSAHIVLDPVQKFVHLPLVFYQKIAVYWTNQDQLRLENEQLKQEMLVQSARLTYFNEQENELKELKSLLILNQNNAFEGRVAEVVSIGRNSFSRKLQIDKGLKDGIVAGQPVLDSAGLLGQITTVREVTSEVTLTLDEKAITPIAIRRTGVKALLYGNTSSLELRYFAQDSDVVIGDEMVTSGLDGVYPSGISVAKVQSVVRVSGDPFLAVESLPIAQIEKTRFVYVLNKKSNPLITEEIKALSLTSDQTHKKTLP
jgi:rod shape-determining protein MreC